MKALLKLIIATVVAMMMVGCGTMTGAAVGAHYGGPGGAAVGAGIGSMVDNQVTYPNGRQVVMAPSYGGGHSGLRIAPCQPYDASNLVNWVKGADADGEGTQHHRRKAEITNSNGHVNCYSSESVGAQQGTAVRRAPQSAARPTATGTDRYPAMKVAEPQWR